tara:strand:- start:401 stop:784 length:384 start_codon:yes stop_codon:yes gene_type:complete
MKNIILKYLYYLSLIFLILVYLVPGNLFGYFLYGDLSIQPNLFSDPNGRSYDHFIYFTFLSIIGFLTYFEYNSIKRVFRFLISISFMLEVLHLIIPNRTFEFSDIIANILGVLFGYTIIMIYKKKYE